MTLPLDDGRSESTPELLDILAGFRVPATFFQCGVNVRRLPQVAREVVAAGHEIGNHTDSHPKLHFKSPEFIFRELASAEETIEQSTGVRPTLFRPPYPVPWFAFPQP